MLKSLRLAISFLTIFPVYQERAESQELGRSVSYYPLVGLLLGALVAGLCYGLHRLGLTLAGDGLVVVALVVLTGGLHMDGLMDTADGLFSGRNLEQKLAIMKDSRVGAMGVMAFATVLLLKTVFLYELSMGLKLTALILAPAAGRWAMVYGIIRFPYARQEGLGGSLAQAGRCQLAVATLILLAAALWLAGPAGLGIAAFVLLGTLATTRFISKCIGGMTGDTYGATGELIEVWTILIILIGQQTAFL